METGRTLKDEEANAWHNLKQKARRGGKRVLIDWSIALTEAQRKHLVPIFPGHTCSTFFLMSRRCKKSCCNKWQHRRAETTDESLKGGAVSAQEL